MVATGTDWLHLCRPNAGLLWDSFAEIRRAFDALRDREEGARKRE